MPLDPASSVSTPPVGDDWLVCTDAPIDPGPISAWVVVPGSGATVTFTGTVRDHAGSHTGVHLLEYEAYEEHVERVLADVAATARSRWPSICRLAVLHRVGALQVTDTAVVVAVSTPHRTAAFEAGKWLIDEVKATAPIWKREHHDAGISWGRCDHAQDRDGVGTPWADLVTKAEVEV